MGNKEHDEEENDLYDAVAQYRKDHPEYQLPIYKDKNGKQLYEKMTQPSDEMIAAAHPEWVKEMRLGKTLQEILLIPEEGVNQLSLMEQMVWYQHKYQEAMSKLQSLIAKS